MGLRTLVLNVYMQPHAVTSWQEGVTLAVCDKADVIAEYDDVCSSPSLSVKIPAVVRLRKEFSPHKRGVKFSRINVLTRDGFKCCYCGKKKSVEELNYDHVVPRSRGGKTEWTNIVSSCFVCNRRKGARTPKEAGLRMHFLPYRPKVLPMTQVLVRGEKPDLWEPYLYA